MVDGLVALRQDSQLRTGGSMDDQVRPNKGYRTRWVSSGNQGRAREDRKSRIRVPRSSSAPLGS